MKKFKLFRSKKKQKISQVTKKKANPLVRMWKKIPIPIRKALISIVVIIGLTGLFSVAAFGWYACVYLDPTIDLGNIDSSLDYTTVVYALDASKKPIEVEHLYKDENRIWVNLSDIPNNLQKAFISIEDERFYKHSGVDWLRTGGAIINMATGGKTYGGSTITQQLIKNLTGDNDVKISRKIQEIRRALYLETEYNKDQILEAYLNTIYFAERCNGVKTAASVYFGKDVKDLSLAECASLAAITNLPSKYNPYISDKTRENNKERQEIILNKMAELGYITEEEAKTAKEEKLAFKRSTSEGSTSTKQSYFVEAMINQVIEDLVEEKGYSYAYASNMVYSGGLSIYSTMETEAQKIMDEAYKKTSTFTTYELDSKGKAPESAMVIINNSTGAVAAMVGGRGEKTINRGLNRAVGSYRQPGSCMKPIGTYAPAFEYKVKINNMPISPGTMVLDSYVKDNWPVNYDVVTNQPMSIERAIQNSTNTVAVKVNMALGASRAYDFLSENLNISSMVPEHDKNSASTALGGMRKGISVLEITAAYETFPNGGTYTEPYYYTKVVDSNGKVLLEKTPKTHAAMSSSTASMINMLLQSAVTGGTGSPSNFGTTAIAGKTGTTSDSKDRWFVGYTSYYTAGVWFGFDDPARINYSGINPAVKAWKTVMSEVHDGLEYKSLSMPTNLITCEYCSESGKLANEFCKKANKAVTGRFISGDQPSAVCDVHKAEEKLPDEAPNVVTPNPKPNPDPSPEPVKPPVQDPVAEPSQDPVEQDPSDDDPTDTDPPPEEPQT